jgi:D-alanyl-D-alanine carboxypeptidase
VLTNQEASPAASGILRAVSALLLTATPTVGAANEHAAAEAQVKGVLAGLQRGMIDRTLLTGDCSFYFSDQTITDFKGSLASLGDVKAVTERGESLRGGMTFRSFTAEFAGGTSLTVTTYMTPDGRLEQFLVEGKS